MTDREKRYLTKIDEINQLFYKPEETYSSAENLTQAVEDFLIDMYLEGFASTGYELNDEEREADLELIEELLYLKIDGKTFADRITEYYTEGISVAEKSAQSTSPYINTIKGQTSKNAPVMPVNEPEKEGNNLPTEEEKKPSMTPTDEIKRVIETESHRMYNEGSLQRGRDAGAKTKQWVTMGDTKVRDTHAYIEGQKKNIDEAFFTYDGDYAQAPGGFLSAENNVNCRCYLKLGF